MFGRLDASIFSGSAPFYEKQFEEILSKIVICYKLMKSDNVSVENDENKIRDYLLLNYLQNDKVRENIDLIQWHFEREVQEGHSAGRTDIKIISPNTFVKQEAYYILECKRLDNKNTSGTSGLNSEYIKNGIGRFTSKHYSSFHKVNGMIGFVVEKMDIHTNTSSINTLLKNSFTSITTSKSITKDTFIEDFDYLYHSKHSDTDKEELKVYHLMFDFHENVQN